MSTHAARARRVIAAAVLPDRTWPDPDAFAAWLDTRAGLDARATLAELLDILGLLPTPEPVVRRPRRADRHGTNTSYNRHKCRCDACKAANRAYRVARGITRFDPARDNAHARAA